MSLPIILSFGLAIVSGPKNDGKTNSDEKPYRIDLSGTTLKVKAGAEGGLSLQIKPIEGYHVSAEAPLKISLTGDGLTLAKNQLGHQDADDPKSAAPRFKVAFSSKAKGERVINADALFFVCSESLCERKTEKVAVRVDVSP
ncbi:MAG: hypothetical protein HY791_00250 [Deltaproteobacteria bacterium]|nr:hypothetical protein [Deltaproteobacteria bacterium]